MVLVAIGADAPHLAAQEVPLPDDRRIGETLNDLVPRPPIGTGEFDAIEAQPLRALLHIVINAILYATSAGVALELKPGAAALGQPRGPLDPTAPVFTSSPFLMT